MFRDAPFILSNTFPDFILSRSGKTLFGVKTYGREWDYNYDVHLDVVIPASVTDLADFSLGEFRARHKYSYNGEEYYGTSTLGMNHVRIVFNGEKPEASELSFAQKWWQWDEESQTSTETNRIECSSVYYHDGASGWSWGEEWCGVKTYALNDIPDAYAVESDIRIGRNFGGGWWSWKKGGATYTEREIWRGNEMGLYGDENAFIEVYGTGAIKPVVFHGDTPSSYLGKVEIWSDQKMFETFTPPGLAASAWKAKNSDCGAPSDHDYYHETANGRDSWEWDMLLWPDKKVVPERRWIVVPAKEVAIWAGIRSIRVGIVGTSEISDTMLVRCTDEAYSPNPNDFFHGMAIFGVETFEAWDDEVAFPIQGEDGQYHAIYMQTYEFGNESAYFKDKQMSFTVKVPSAGTMVVTGGDDWGSDSCIDYEEPAYKEDFTVVGDKIVSDVVQRLSAEWDDGGDNSNFIWNETNFWKTSCSAVVRRIAVSGGTTLTFTRRDDGDDAEFKRMYFFPQGVRSVAVEAAYIGYEQTTNARYSDYWGHNYVQGYVTGNGVYKSGETATLKAISGDGEEFDHWVVRFGNLTLTDAQKTSPTLSFMVTDAMCGAMEDEAQIFLSAIWKPKYKLTVLPSIVGAGTVTGTGRYHEGTTVTLSAIPAQGCTFVKWSDGETAATRTVTIVPADIERIIYACFEAPGGVPGQDAYAVFFDGNGGDVSESVRMVEKGKAVGTLPTATREKYKFLGWFTAASGGTQVSASTIVKSGVTYYAHWTKLPDNDPTPTPDPDPTPDPTPDPDPTPGPGSTPESKDVYELFDVVDGAAPTAAASEYNGYLYDANSGAVKGTIQVKIGKPGKKDGKASVKATVIVGTKKVTLKGADKGKAVLSADGPTEIELVGGEACAIVLGSEGISGYYGAYLIGGSRDFFASKDKGEVAVANDILSKWLGSFMIIWDGGSLSVSIAAKGKVKVSGTLADGKTKVSASTVLLVGEEWSCVSVAEQKANLALALWLSNDGQTVEAEGLGDDVLVGKPGSLANGAAFHVDADEFASVFGQAMLPYLPDGVPVAQKGTKWSLPKAGKVVYKNGAVDKSKLGDNPCALKLTYKAKEGTFKGSFKVYTEVKGKPKATTVNVTGFLLNGIGYGTATIKGKGSVSVTIE